jgi:hypothetical protein
MAEVSELKGKVGVEGVAQTTTGLKAVGDGMRKLGDEATGAAGKLAATQSTWSRFKQDFTSGFNFSAGLSAFNMLKDGLGNVASMAMTAATEYESAMNILDASSSATDAQMAAFGETARALGADLNRIMRTLWTRIHCFGLLFGGHFWRWQKPLRFAI